MFSPPAKHVGENLNKRGDAGNCQNKNNKPRHRHYIVKENKKRGRPNSETPRASQKVAYCFLWPAFFISKILPYKKRNFIVNKKTYETERCQRQKNKIKC